MATRVEGPQPSVIGRLTPHWGDWAETGGAKTLTQHKQWQVWQQKCGAQQPPKRTHSTFPLTLAAMTAARSALMPSSFMPACCGGALSCRGVEAAASSTFTCGEEVKNMHSDMMSP